MAVSIRMGDMTLPDLEGHRAATESFVPMDEEAFRAFYDRTSRPVWAYLSRITGDRQLADDLLQEAYYRFYRAGAAHVDEAHRRNSLFRIATNLAHDHRRMLQHRVDRNAAELDDESHTLSRLIGRPTEPLADTIAAALKAPVTNSTH